MADPYHDQVLPQLLWAGHEEILGRFHLNDTGLSLITTDSSAPAEQEPQILNSK